MIEAMFAGYDPAELAAASEAQRDIHGTFQDEAGNDEPSNEETAAQDVKDAISRLPANRREAYDQAVAYNPKIADLESPPRRFLLATDNDYWAAACRIADYWNKRRELFGPDRFYRPMKICPEQEEDSCLNSVTREALRSGAYMALLLPDKFGRPVFFLDMERFTEACKEPETRVMVVFYLLQVLSESDLAVRNGFVGIFATETASEVAKSQHFRPSPECVRLALSEVIPTKGRAGHLLALRKPNFFQQSMNLWMSCFQHWNRVEARSVLHYADSKEESLIDLTQYGFSSHHLPERFGGTVNFDKWYQDRVKLEEERYASFRAAAGPARTLDTEQAHDSSLDDSFSDQDDRKPAAMEPAELARLKRQKVLKRKMEEVHDYNRCEMAKRKVAKLQSDGESLRKDNHLLKAQLVCSDHITDLYKKDRALIKQRVVECISEFIPSVPGVALDMTTSHEKHELLAESLLTYFLEFQGRNPVNGRWIFRTAESNLSNGVVSDLDWLQRNLLQYQETLGESLRPRRDDNDSKIQARDPLSSASAQDISYGSDEEVSKLKARVDTLQEENKSLKRTRPFLESLLVCATYAAEEHLKDRKEIEDEMVELFSDSPNLLPSVKLLVNNILNDFTIFEGRNPRTGQKLYHFVGGLLQTLHMFSSEGQAQHRQHEIQQQQAEHAMRLREADELWKEARAKRKRDLKRL